jgi:small subunit ribosomal protein S18
VARNPKLTKRNSQDRRPKPTAAGGRPRRGRPKICIFCAGHATWVDYKDVALLKRFLNDRGRIKARGATGTCAQHQRDVATAVKTARELALLPYTVRAAATESRGPRGGDRRGDGPAVTGGDTSAPETSGPSPAASGESDDTESALAVEVADSPFAAPV